MPDVSDSQAFRLAAFAIVLAMILSSTVFAAYYDPQKGWSDETHPWDRDVTPVTEALFLKHPDYEDTFQYALFRGEEQGFMTDEEVESYIAARYSDGEVTAEDWLQSYNLFSACIWLAYKNREKPEERRHWLSIALDAARKNLHYDCLNTEVVSDASREFESREDFAPDRAWFFGRLTDAYREHLKGDERQRAITLYNIGIALSEKGDLALAKQAFESAHRLFPGDNTILRRLKETFEELGDYAAALATLDKIGWTLKEEDMNSINGLANAAANGINAGNLCLLLKEIKNAQKVFERALAYLHRFETQYAEQSVVREAKSGIPRKNPADINARHVNQCATGLGLCALAKGDRKTAVAWFKESFVNSRYMGFKGYDLRLVKELMKDPSLRKLCIGYLQLAVERKWSDTTEEAKAFLAQLTGDQTEIKTPIKAVPGRADAIKPDDSTARKPVTEPSRTGRTSSQDHEKKRKNTGAVVVVIVAAVLGGYYASRKRKSKEEKR